MATATPEPDGPPNASGRRKKQLVGIGKVALMIAPLLWIWPRIDGHAIVGGALRFGLVAFAFAALGLSLTIVVNGFRWHALLRAHDASPLPSRGMLISQSFIALYMNQLPGGVAGDVVRAHTVRHSVQGTATSMAILVLERVCGLVALLGLAAAGALNVPTWDGRVGSHLQLVALITGAVLVAAIGGPLLLGRVPALTKLPLVGPVLSRLRRPRRLGPLIEAVGLSFVIHMITVVVITSFVMAIAPGASLRTVVAMTPIAMLITFIPLTPAGFGQREAAFVKLYGFAGVSANEAIAASLLWFTASTFSLGVGLVLAALHRVRE